MCYHMYRALRYQTQMLWKLQEQQTSTPHPDQSSPTINPDLQQAESLMISITYLSCLMMSSSKNLNTDYAWPIPASNIFVISVAQISSRVSSNAYLVLFAFHMMGLHLAVQVR